MWQVHVDFSTAQQPSCHFRTEASKVVECRAGQDLAGNSRGLVLAFLRCPSGLSSSLGTSRGSGLCSKVVRVPRGRLGEGLCQIKKSSVFAVPLSLGRWISGYQARKIL